MTQHMPRHRNDAKVLTPFSGLRVSAGTFGKRSAAAASAVGVAATTIVATTASSLVPTAVPATPKADFTANLKAAESNTLVSLDVEWDSGDTFTVEAEEPPAPEPEPVVQTTASRSADRAAVVDQQVPTSAPPARMGSVVATAMQYLGYPYVWGTRGPNSFDCSGFTSYIYGLHGISLSSSSAAQWGAGTPVSRADAQPGDLMVKAGHVAIYIGNGQVIHASTPRTGVTISPLSWYDGQHIEFRRF